MPQIGITRSSSRVSPVRVPFVAPLPPLLFMNYVFVLAVLAGGALSLSACWMAWLLLRQHGRLLLRLDALEKRLEPFEGGDATEAAREPIGSLTPAAEPCDVAGQTLRQHMAVARQPWYKRAARKQVALTVATLHWLMFRVALAHSAVATLELRRFKFVPRPDDIFVVTYPRSGTTWMQMILYQLTTDGSMEISHIAQHSPWFERSADSDQGYEDRAAPRVFKSHLPFEQIPKGPGRYIYVARDGRDVAVSYFNFYRSHNGYKGTFAEFFELFLCGKETSHQECRGATSNKQAHGPSTIHEAFSPCGGQENCLGTTAKAHLQSLFVGSCLEYCVCWNLSIGY